MRNQRLSQAIAVAAHLTPAAARAASSYVTDAVDGSKYDHLLALLQVGTLAGAGTINARFQHCSGSASSLAAWADVNSTSCITSTFASTSNDKIGELELQVDQNSTLERYLRVLVTTAVSTWIGGVQVLGTPRYLPATDVDHADVVQTVVF